MSSVCLAVRSLTRIRLGVLELLYVIEIYYLMFHIETEVCSVHCSFIETLKNKLLYYVLWDKIVLECILIKKKKA